MTHWSLGICEQPKIVRRQLCNNILSQDPYRYDTNLDEKNIDYRCDKRSVHLRMREIENLQPMDFSMWLCPEPSRNVPVFYNFFISKSQRKNSALVFRMSLIRTGAKIYPDTAVSTIDRVYLSTIIVPQH